MPVRPSPALIVLGLASLFLGTPSLAVDSEVSLTVTNRGPEALRCQWQLAHWMTASALALPPGAATEISFWREESGALFLRHEGEPRPFHIEELLCGPDQSFGQERQALDLSTLRRGETTAVALSCATDQVLSCDISPLR